MSAAHLKFRQLLAAKRKAPDSYMGGALAGVGVRLSDLDGMLVCMVTTMPTRRFNSVFLREGPGHLVPVLSPEGEASWNALTALGKASVAPGDLFALILHPDAIDLARGLMAEAVGAAA